MGATNSAIGHPPPPPLCGAHKNSPLPTRGRETEPQCVPQSTALIDIVTALLLAPAGVFFVFLLIAPLVVVLVFSFGERAAAGGYEPAFTFDNYLNLAARGKAFVNTLTLAPLATLLTALFAFPMAYFLAVKVNPKWRVALAGAGDGAVLDQPAAALLRLDDDPRREGHPVLAGLDRH